MMAKEVKPTWTRKRRFIVPKGSVGLCREAAMRSAKSALKVAAEARLLRGRMLSRQRAQHRVPLSGHLSPTT